MTDRPHLPHMIASSDIREAGLGLMEVSAPMSPQAIHELVDQLLVEAISPEEQ